MIRRIILLLSVGALMAAMLAMGGPAYALHGDIDPNNPSDCWVFVGQPHSEIRHEECESVTLVPADDPHNPFTGQENPPPPPPPPEELNCKDPVLTTSGQFTCDKQQLRLAKAEAKEEAKEEKAAAKEQKKAAK